MIWLQLICASIVSVVVLSKIVPIVDEKIEFCVGPEEMAGIHDFSNVKLVAESDTKVFLNGSLTVLKEIKSPWTVTFFAEKFDRGQWNTESIHQKIPDLCKDLKNPTKSWYRYTARFQHKCPYRVGMSEKFDMLDIVNTELGFPSNFEGRWRLNVISEIAGQNGKKDCIRFYCDLVDV